MSTVTLMRVSSAARYCAIELPIDIPSVATRSGSTSARCTSQSTALRLSAIIWPHNTRPRQSISLKVSSSVA